MPNFLLLRRQLFFKGWSWRWVFSLKFIPKCHLHQNGRKLPHHWWLVYTSPMNSRYIHISQRLHWTVVRYIIFRFHTVYRNKLKTIFMETVEKQNKTECHNSLDSYGKLCLFHELKLPKCEVKIYGKYAVSACAEGIGETWKKYRVLLWNVCKNLKLTPP